METIKEYLDQIHVFQWRLNRPPDQIDFGGVFIIRATTKRDDGDHENVTNDVTAPYCVSDRNCLLDLNTTKELLGHAFQELFLGRSLVNLNSLVDNLAEDLLCQFRFSPEFLNREDTRPVIVFDLIIAVKKEKTHHHDDLVEIGSETMHNSIRSENELHDADDGELKEIEDAIEDYLNLSPRTNENQNLNSGLHEVKPALKIKKFSEAYENQVSDDDDDDDGDHSMVKLCSICLDKLSQGEVVAETTACRHMFHRNCVLNWLIRADSCPVCRSSFRIPACRPCFRISI